MNQPADDSWKSAPIVAPWSRLSAAVITVLSIALVVAAIGFVFFLSRLSGAEAKPSRPVSGDQFYTRELLCEARRSSVGR